MGEHSTDLASRLRTAFDRHHARRLSELASILAPQATAGPVLVMMVNRGYSELFVNWVRLCDRNAIDVRS